MLAVEIFCLKKKKKKWNYFLPISRELTSLNCYELVVCKVLGFILSMTDRDDWWERVMGIRAVNMTWWWCNIRNLLNTKLHQHIKSNAGVYSISCLNCNMKYVSEMSHSLQTRIYEHKQDIHLGNLNNAVLLHMSKTNHNFNFNAATMLAYIHNKKLRKICKAGVILLSSSLNTRPGHFNLSPFLSKLILISYKISN